MNRSTFRSVRAGLASIAFCLSLSSFAGLAHAAPAAEQTGTVDITYGDGDEGPIGAIVRSTIATPARASRTLQPGDVLYGDSDEGVIGSGPTIQTTLAQHGQPVSAQSTHDLIFTDGDQGGEPVDLSAFAGRGSISAAELAGAKPELAAELANVAYQFEVD